MASTRFTWAMTVPQKVSMGTVVSDSGIPPLKLPDISEKDATQGLPNQEDSKATDRSGTYHTGGSGLLCDHCDECAAFQCDTCGIIYCAAHDEKNHQGVLSHHKRNRIVRPSEHLSAPVCAPVEVAAPTQNTPTVVPPKDAVDSFLAATADLEAAVKVPAFVEEIASVVIEELTPDTAPIPEPIVPAESATATASAPAPAEPAIQEPISTRTVEITPPPSPPAPAVPPPASTSMPETVSKGPPSATESELHPATTATATEAGELPSSSHEFEAFLEKKRRRQKSLLESLSSQSAPRGPSSVPTRGLSEPRTPAEAAAPTAPQMPAPPVESYRVGIPPAGINPHSGLPHAAQQGAVPSAAVDRSAAITVRRQMLAAMKQTLDWAEGPVGHPQPMPTGMPPCGPVPVLSLNRGIHPNAAPMPVSTLKGGAPSVPLEGAGSQPRPMPPQQAPVFDPTAPAPAQPAASPTCAAARSAGPEAPSDAVAAPAATSEKDELADLKRGTEASLEAIEKRLGAMEKGAADVVAAPGTPPSQHSPSQQPLPASPVVVDSLPPTHPLAADRWAALEADATRFQAQVRQLQKENGKLEDALREREKAAKAKDAAHEAELSALREELAAVKQQQEAEKESVAQCTQQKTELMLSLEQERSLRLSTELELAAGIEKERAAKLEAEAQLLEAQEKQKEVADTGLETAATLQKTLQQLNDLEQKHQATLDAHGAVERLNQALTGRVASLEHVLTSHAANQEATRQQDSPLFPATKEVPSVMASVGATGAEQVRQAPPVIAAPSVDGASLRSKVAERIERGDLKAEEGTDNAADAEEIRNSKYPLNFTARLAEASGEGAPPIDSPATVQRKQEREERLAAITMSWDNQMNAARKDDDDRRAQLMAMAEQTNLAKHVESMQDALNHSVTSPTA